MSTPKPGDMGTATLIQRASIISGSDELGQSHPIIIINDQPFLFSTAREAVTLGIALLITGVLEDVRNVVIEDLAIRSAGGAVPSDGDEIIEFFEDALSGVVRRLMPKREQ